MEVEQLERPVVAVSLSHRYPAMELIKEMKMFVGASENPAATRMEKYGKIALNFIMRNMRMKVLHYHHGMQQDLFAQFFAGQIIMTLGILPSILVFSIVIEM